MRSLFAGSLREKDLPDNWSGATVTSDSGTINGAPAAADLGDQTWQPDADDAAQPTALL